MTAFPEIRRRARLTLGPLVGTCLAFYFGYHAIYGARGILAISQLDQKIQATQEMLRLETEQREMMERRVALLRPGSVDPDLLEERARLLLNFGRAEDVIVLDPVSRDGRKLPVRVTSP